MENSDKNSEQSKQPEKTGNKPEKTPDNLSSNQSTNTENANNKADATAIDDKDGAAKAEDAKKETGQNNAAKPSAGQAAPKKSGGGKFATVMSLLALGVGGTSMYMQVDPNAEIPFLSEKIAASSSSINDDSGQDIAALTSKVEQFDARLNSLSGANTSESAQADNAKVTQLQSQIEQLQARIEQQAANSRAVDGDDNVTQLKQSQQQLTQQLQQVLQDNESLKQTLDEVKQQQSYLSGTVDNVSSQLPDTQDQSVWVLRDVELTLKQANRLLNTVSDIDAVLPLMKSAQQQLLDLRRSDLVSMTNTLQQEIESLSAVDAPSKSQVLQDITELAAASVSLPLIGDSKNDSGQSENDELQSATDRVADAGAGFLRSLTDMIEVEKDGQGIRPIVSNELRELARQRTQLILESANAAYISADYALFKQRLSAAKEWVTQHFDTNAQVTQGWLVQLDELMASMPSGELPDISQSLAELSQVLKAGG